jgi:hypothetical protein
MPPCGLLWKYTQDRRRRQHEENVVAKPFLAVWSAPDDAFITAAVIMRSQR